MIQTAIEAAKAAGKILLENFDKNKEISVKDDKSLVSNIDIACEKKIEEIILEKFPEHDFLGEENDRIDKGSDYKWVVDPLDGTNNYVNEIPMYGVSIALAYKDEPILGVIYLPFFDELYTAEKGKGCFLNEKKRMEIKEKPLDQSLVLMSSHYLKLNTPDALRLVQKVYKTFLEIRITGCAVFNVAMFLKNSFGGGASTNVKPWDLAAGVVMAREAGGIATNHNGDDWTINDDRIVIGNKVCHERILEIVQMENKND
ncbi:MAG: inositol monophosphatase [Nanoarchaeota archaeon]|nr:inositol monophosphatase [Nanoarchaeota archaeon]MCG2718372.1 inositol monophosphatase [Nanoarchaeota archaeon]